jgi:AbiV family abortive infection protein
VLLPKFKTNRKRIVIELWNHIVFLIQDAFILYDNKKYSSSCFMAFTAFEEIGKLNKFILGGKSINGGLTRNHGEKHLFSITGHLSVSSHITRCFRREEKWFTSKFKKCKKNYGLMEFRNNLLYYDKNHIPSKKFKSKDAKSMIIIALEVLYQTEGFMDYEFAKESIILRCQKDFKFNKKLLRK